ncbi:MAG TPA: D-alanyl-D-alanine carboxypeptidase [Actinobacteria bacterium]|nr:D-alanyl-D-alanine carboxypeptidase [Actinomycetota bacterium]
MFKKISITSLILIVFLNALFLPSFGELTVDSSSAVLIDSQTGKVLWAKNPNVRRKIASTTKIMTGLLVIEELSPEEVVTSDASVESTGESEIYLEKGEKMTVSDLLYALMLRSANDAAVALANQVSGSVESFAKRMDKRAKTLGLKNTDFSSPHGLWDQNTSTAYDMALLGREALKNEVFATIVNTKTTVIKGKRSRKIINRNNLLWQYPRAVGIKTGYTKASGYCLVSAAQKGPVRLIAATLNSSVRQASFDDAKKLFKYGFSQLKYTQIVKKGQVKAKTDVPYSFEKMSLIASKDFGVVTEKKSKIITEIDLRKEVKLPINKGDVLGHIKVYEGKKLLAKQELVAQKDAAEVGLFEKLGFWLKSLFRTLSPASIER